jgi:RNA polymerase sigma-70 factor (ECF subfamily)
MPGLFAHDRLAGARSRTAGQGPDLVQETLLHAVRSFGTFEGDSEAELLAWLRRLLVNNLTDFTRLYRATGKRQVAREIALGAGGPSEPGAPELSADISSPSGRAVRHEEAESIEKAMQRLPEDYRRVLVLRYENKQSFNDIGRVMHRSANAARKLWLRALERLQEELKQPP